MNSADHGDVDIVDIVGTVWRDYVDSANHGQFNIDDSRHWNCNILDCVEHDLCETVNIVGHAECDIVNSMTLYNYWLMTH